MKRSRVQAQRIEHELQKAERKKQAELERHLELEDRVNLEIEKKEQEKELLIRKALLEEDKNIRHNLSASSDVFRQEHLRNIQNQLANEYLNSERLREQERNAALAESALQVEH